MKIERIPADGAALARAMTLALRSAPPAARDGPSFPRAWWQHLGAGGLLGVGFEPDVGGARAGWPVVADLCRLIARETASMGLALAWLLNEMLGRFVIAPNADPATGRALLQAMAGGRTIVGMAISEPDAGAHPKRLASTARRDAGRWRLDGRKSHVSNGPAASAFVVLAVSEESAGRKRFDAFVVDATQPGLTVHPAARAALPPLGHAGLALEACFVPDAARLTRDGGAFERIARPLRIVEDALLTSAIAGAMQCELEALVAWLHGTQPSPATTRRLGALRLELSALETVAAQSARHLERHGPDDALAGLNVGARLLLDGWQAGFEAFAATLDDLGDRLHGVAADIRTVLGIARSVGEARQLAAGTALLQSRESDEVAA